MNHIFFKNPHYVICGGRLYKTTPGSQTKFLGKFCSSLLLPSLPLYFLPLTFPLPPLLSSLCPPREDITGKLSIAMCSGKYRQIRGDYYLTSTNSDNGTLGQ